MGQDRIVVTGGTGVLGRAVVRRLLGDGHPVRVVSRRSRPEAGVEAYEWATADLRSGTGAVAAVRGARAVVHCATGFGRGQEEAIARALVAAVREAGEDGTAPHLVYVSIVGVDRIPFGYYKAKLAAERVFEESGLPYTIQRATQFHDLLRTLFAVGAKSPLVPVPALRFQPVDVRDVAARLAELAVAEPVFGRAPDIGGPRVRDARELARVYLAETGRARRPLLPIAVPGRVFGAFRAGGNLVPGEPYGTIGFEEYLADLDAPRRAAYR
ncbi:NmrA family transcriptional regulator [Streptacidiphilus pinicola]|uniref:NmrA family transcriptional regulator n=1 Tax=Streptacidiphilus pinicola TaxID=2219663 RepID=A0A2X0ILA0_9ACTN|nr:SDR family oxidoreductase [Streptacidiphilus pinicola]RAG84111.1 NmrA family transcriptional regulator [Streptacidiphilus pinicola]